MNQASVGVHCPECVKDTKQRVYTANNLPGSQGIVTRGLVGINVALWFLSIAALGATFASAGGVGADYGTWGIAIAENNEWWRVVSGGFLHSGFIHIGFNMYLLWQLGQQLERILGEVRFGLVYMVSLLGGSFGALLLDPQIPVVGASGAVFGLIGLTVMAYRSRGIGLFDTGLGSLILINALLSFRSGVSLGGHLGGFVIGALLGVLWFGMNPGDGPVFGRDQRKPTVITAAVGAALFVGSVVVSGLWESPIF
jgi:membrane associated rhomboid family serine protease